MDRFEGMDAMEGCLGIGAEAGARERKERWVLVGYDHDFLRTAIACLLERCGYEVAHLSIMPVGSC